MPASRRQAKACRARAGQWLAVGAVFAGVLVMICITCHKTWGVGPDPLAHEIRQMADRIETSGRTISTLREQLVASRWKLDTFRGVGQQPDWSVLLTLLSDGLGSDVVLRSCELDEIMISLKKTTGRRGGTQVITTNRLEDKGERMAFVLRVAGFGRSQTAVSLFVLRLERSGMFDNVRIVSTIREPFLNAKAIAFRLECRLEGTTGRKR